MVIYLFRDESRTDTFAFSIDVTGANIPPITPHTEWIFLERIDTLKFPGPWDITDFQEVLDHLKETGIASSKVSSLSSRQGGGVVDPRWSASSASPTFAAKPVRMPAHP